MNSWLTAFKDYTRPRTLAIFVLGFSSGLPIMLVFSTLSFWLREAGVDRATIGFFSWIALAYGVKWIWSPLVDALPLPILSKTLGRRRAWLLLAQLSVAACLLGMGRIDPSLSAGAFALLAVGVAFSSATQDITIDAYRIESGSTGQQATFAAAYMVGYRLAMLLATAGALAIAAHFDQDPEVYDLFAWQNTYMVMALCMLPGILTTLLMREPRGSIPVVSQARRSPSEWFRQAVFMPFYDFWSRYRKLAILILALISCYRISDIVMGIVANVFYVDMGYTKEEVATISKVFGVIMTLAGAGLGGLLIRRYGIMPILMLGAVLSAATNLLFAGLSQIGHSVEWLTVIISADNLSGGIATTAFIAYLSSLTRVAYSATQYALFSSVMVIFPKFLGGFSGVTVDEIGYFNFFTLTAVLGIPVLILIVLAWRHLPPPELQDEEPTDGTSELK
ncbi:AmpG family muropeptide MFS transporter [Pokkaliibacter sp. CJK22405]|uniref:AmpG family muropeptide MFS transporter n=1 Tax=Pokkaliibacter sp. CJK22405 TaxID=3384615 RepID=UPI0039855CF2